MDCRGCCRHSNKQDDIGCKAELCSPPSVPNAAEPLTVCHVASFQGSESSCKGQPVVVSIVTRVLSFTILPTLTLALLLCAFPVYLPDVSESVATTASTTSQNFSTDEVGHAAPAASSEFIHDVSHDSPPLSERLRLSEDLLLLRNPYTLQGTQNGDKDGVIIEGPYPRLCVLTRTYPAVYQYLPAFLMSWTQMPLNVSVLLVVTEREQKLDLLGDILKYVSYLGGEGKVQLLPIDESSAKAVFPLLGQVQEYGYAYTDAALDMLLGPNPPENCNYLIVTNGDNLYSRLLPRHVMPLMKKNIDLIAFDFISGHRPPGADRLQKFSTRYSKRSGPQVLVDSFLMKPMRTIFQKGYVDLGAMVVSVPFLKRSGLRFLGVELNDTSEADGVFAERAARLTRNRVVIGQTLLIHQ